MATLRDDVAAEQTKLKTAGGGVLESFRRAGTALVREVHEWVEADGTALIQGLGEKWSPDPLGLGQLGVKALFGFELSDIGSVLLGEIVSAIGVGTNTKVDAHAEAFKNLANLSEEANQFVVEYAILGVSEEMYRLGHLGGRLTAFTSMAAESEQDTRSGLGARFRQVDEDGQEIEGERKADFEAHVALEVAQADAKVHDFFEVATEFRQVVAAIDKAASDLRTRGRAEMQRAKDKYLQYLTRDAQREEPPHPNRPGTPEHKAAVDVRLELAHTPQVRAMLNNLEIVPRSDNGFIIARLDSRIVSDTPGSKVMEQHVRGKSLSELAKLGLPVRVTIDPSSTICKLDKNGVEQREGDASVLARFSRGLVAGDPPLQRRDLGRRSPERGALVLDHVMSLLKARPMQSTVNQVIRDL